MADNSFEDGIENINLKQEDNRVVVRVNPDIFPLEVIYSAAYVMIDRAFVMVDGDPKENIYVDLKPKESSNLKKLGHKFNNELLNYAVYVTQAARNKDLREAIVSRALSYNTKESQRQEEDYLEDPKGIAEPWSPEKGNKTENDAKSEKE